MKWKITDLIGFDKNGITGSYNTIFDLNCFGLSLEHIISLYLHQHLFTKPVREPPESLIGLTDLIGFGKKWHNWLL